MNKLNIYINGMRYPIKTHEDPAYVAGLAQEIDTQMRELTSAGYSMAEAMVLLSLSYLDNWKKAEQNADNLRSQVSQYLEDASKLRAELGEARRDMDKLKRPEKGKDKQP